MISFLKKPKAYSFITLISDQLTRTSTNLNPCIFSGSCSHIKMMEKPIAKQTPKFDISLHQSTIYLRERERGEKRTYFTNGFNQIPRQPIWIDGENNFSDKVQEEIRSQNWVFPINLYIWERFIITSGEISVFLHWPLNKNGETNVFPQSDFYERITSRNLIYGGSNHL